MARQEWAQKRVDQLMRLDMSFADETDVVWLLKLEHARAVRIVKREIDRIKKGQYTFTAGAKDSVLNELQRVLELLQKGRA